MAALADVVPGPSGEGEGVDAGQQMVQIHRPVPSDVVLLGAGDVADAFEDVGDVVESAFGDGERGAGHVEVDLEVLGLPQQLRQFTRQRNQTVLPPSALGALPLPALRLGCVALRTLLLLLPHHYQIC